VFDKFTGVLDKVTESIYDGLGVEVIFLDFAKAFDKVPNNEVIP